MKTLRGLNERILPLEDDPSQELLEAMPTYRKAYRMFLGGSRAKNGDESIACIDVGLKLSITENVITLEDADFKLIKEKVTENLAGLNAVWQGNSLKRLRANEKESEEADKKEKDKDKK